MKVKRYFAPNMQESLKAIRNDLGPDAVILSTTNVDGGVEIVAALDYEETAQTQPAASAAAPRPSGMPQGEPKNPAAKPSPSQIARMHAEKHVALQKEMEKARRRIEDAKAKRAKARDKSEDPHLASGKQMADTQAEAGATSDISSVRNEISKLKEFINAQLGQGSVANAPAPTLLQNKLQQSLDGLSIARPIQQPLLGSVRHIQDFEEAWQSIKSQLLGSITVEANELIDQGGVHALVGPTGSGKTMTIGKLAARYVMRYGAESIALVTTDRYRIAAHEQLKVFGRILNVPVHAVQESEGLDDVLSRLENKKLVLIDTAGLMHNDRCWSEQLQELKLSDFDVNCHLVVSAVGQYQVMQSTYFYYRMVGLRGCMVTKLDEAVSLGEILSFLIDSRLTLSYYTDGQRVPEDLHVASKQQMWQKAEAVLNSSERWVSIHSQDATSPFGEVYDGSASYHLA